MAKAGVRSKIMPEPIYTGMPSDWPIAINVSIVELYFFIS